MKTMKVLTLTVVLVTIVGNARLSLADEKHVESAPSENVDLHARYTPTDYPAAFGIDPTVGWLDPWPHSHFSRRGTPFVHLFGLEPAFLDRDLFFDYRYTRGEEEDEQEVEVELEWAFTRRIGLVVEAPVLQLNPEEGDTETGVGDFAVAPRFLLVDTDRFLMSVNTEFSFPTGDDDRGLGSGEVGFAPSLSAWVDLGNWFTVSAQAGTEHGFDSGDSELFYKAALTYSFLLPSGIKESAHEHAYRHFPPGLTNLILEYAGVTSLSGDEDGTSTHELLFGVSYNVTGSWEVRGAYVIPLGEPEEIDDAFVFSVIYHF